MGIGLIDIDAKDCMMLKAHQSLSNKELSLITAVQVSQQYLLERLSFSHFMFLPPLSKIN